MFLEMRSPNGIIGTNSWIVLKEYSVFNFNYHYLFTGRILDTSIVVYIQIVGENKFIGLSGWMKWISALSKMVLYNLISTKATDNSSESVCVQLQCETRE